MLLQFGNAFLLFLSRVKGVSDELAQMKGTRNAVLLALIFSVAGGFFLPDRQWKLLRDVCKEQRQQIMDYLYSISTNKHWLTTINNNAWAIFWRPGYVFVPGYGVLDLGGSFPDPLDLPFGTHYHLPATLAPVTTWIMESQPVAPATSTYSAESVVTVASAAPGSFAPPTTSPGHGQIDISGELTDGDLISVTEQTLVPVTVSFSGSVSESQTGSGTTFASSRNDIEPSDSTVSEIIFRPTPESVTANPNLLSTQSVLSGGTDTDFREQATELLVDNAKSPITVAADSEDRRNTDETSIKPDLLSSSEIATTYTTDKTSTPATAVHASGSPQSSSTTNPNFTELRDNKLREIIEAILRNDTLVSSLGEHLQELWSNFLKPTGTTKSISASTPAVYLVDNQNKFSSAEEKRVTGNSMGITANFANFMHTNALHASSTVKIADANIPWTDVESLRNICQEIMTTEPPTEIVTVDRNILLLDILQEIYDRLKT